MPATAGALAVQVNAPPTVAQAAVLAVVRLVAMDAGLVAVPVNGVVPTVVSVMITDAVFGETNFGARELDVVVFADGTVMVKRDVVIGASEPAVGEVTGVAGTPCETPPPLHAANRQTAIAAIPVFIVRCLTFIRFAPLCWRSLNRHADRGDGNLHAGGMA